ncbi:DUF5343 domain-containing protein [Streptomyces cylindrosporus]|uniref:DUF5343 domain-containing protein n=1 Tax=Streptomyces cylindrosporus TaxID=2927583 RepID=A0ABS9YBR6_9ACTN|nr:DUF5343 domain-containing protein [Streptomyces cylindrosporus]MCI3273346.1 DUF5343 domain-containing protein [Streptomyces cylindrosporus]
MAADNSFPYTPTPGKLEEFLEKLQGIGVPARIDQQYLGSVGFASSNCRPFIPIMKKVGLLDGSGKPTELYTKGLRGGEGGRALLSAGIRAGYDNVFQTYSDANSRSDTELATFFKSHSDLDDKKVGLAVKTFKAVCKFGDFNSSAGNAGKEGDEGEVDEQADLAKGRRQRQQGSNGPGSVVINVNIALSVDATSDAAVYDAFFAAMAKHLTGLTDGGA